MFGLEFRASFFAVCTLALAFAAGAADASSIHIQSIVSSWISVEPGAIGADKVTGLAGDEIRWGAPLNASMGKSGYDFDSAAAPFGVATGAEFTLGTFTHQNYTIGRGTGIRGATLQVTLSFYLDVDDPGRDPLRQLTSEFAFTHWETPNDAATCANGGKNKAGVNRAGCADRVLISTAIDGSNRYSFSDTNGSYEYSFDIAGFRLGDRVVDEFWTAEGLRSSAQLVARFNYSQHAGLAPSPVPLPAGGLLLLGGLGVLGVVRRHRKAA